MKTKYVVERLKFEGGHQNTMVEEINTYTYRGYQLVSVTKGVDPFTGIDYTEAWLQAEFQQTLGMAPNR